ncbi:hypothetical protein LH612_29765, partial [Klebsiella pneumoniae]|nr:hypothetical protein [Klebsiella pneumoniae]
VSQLHQLRGRVGRGSAPGLCLLVTEAAAGTTTRERLDAVASTTDGFELARLDLEIRREGDILGEAQSGRRSGLKMLSLLRDEDVIARAREEAERLVAADPELRKNPGLARLAAEHSELVMAGRSHNVAAQATTLGKRFATVADELLVAFNRLEELLIRYPLRGLKGPGGTAQDALDLLGGDPAKLAELERRIAGHLGFGRTFSSVGQVYPRSLDFEVVTTLSQLAAAPSSL